MITCSASVEELRLAVVSGRTRVWVEGLQHSLSAVSGHGVSAAARQLLQDTHTSLTNAEKMITRISFA